MEKKGLQNFGIATFDKKRMKKSLPYPIYLKWKNAIRKEDVLDKQTADIIAHAMKEWALENGATHYCHWFQPLNGLTAKKHDAFLDRNMEADPIIRFSGKELIKGEPDASSFPSGGMRSTFEARGYTYWDCTANSFIIDNIMYIPSIFVSFKGETLDKKGPLLKSMDFVSEHGTNLVNLFSDKHIYRLRSKVGLEQEFFLVDKKLYDQRADLKNTGRTLIGARPPKGQELDDHYFGAIPRRVMDFYTDVNEELWSLGIYAKTEHNEVAPGQFELAILFENTNVAVDDNQLCMEILQKIALKHDMVCLLHEKPFNGMNGSGKHNNWSLLTNYGENLFDPGDDPANNILFLLFTSAVIKAVDEYAGLLRVASSSTTNDNRLGGDEAPPATISIFLGDDLEDMFLGIIDENYQSNFCSNEFKINNLSYVPHDLSDRNRTSPFAFTGNKFEFRMLGSSNSAADVNIVLNTTVGANLKEFTKILEVVPQESRREVAYNLVKEVVGKHKRILFGKDNYSKDWEIEASCRGLENYKTYFEALVNVMGNDNFSVFYDNNIFHEKEMKAIFHVGLEDVVNIHSLETRTLRWMINKDVIPAALRELKDLGEAYKVTNSAVVSRRISLLNKELEELCQLLEEMEEKYDLSKGEEDIVKKADILQNQVVPYFGEIRLRADEIERTTSRENYKIPSYEDLLTSLD